MNIRKSIFIAAIAAFTIQVAHAQLSKPTATETDWTLWPANYLFEVRLSGEQITHKVKLILRETFKVSNKVTSAGTGFTTTFKESNSVSITPLERDGNVYIAVAQSLRYKDIDTLSEPIINEYLLNNILGTELPIADEVGVIALIKFVSVQ
jgi:hypothetical protein